MTEQIPPIVKAAERLIVDIDQAARGFSAYHRNRIGKDLHDQALAIVELAYEAWIDKARRLRLVRQLRKEVDKLQRRLQIAMLLRATTSFNQFGHLGRQVVALGNQAGGWYKSLQHPDGQNAQGPSAVAQRAKTLSTRAASAGANR